MKMNKIKKIMAVILTAVTILVTLSVTAFAADSDISVKVDGKAVAFPNQKPAVVNNCTLVPVRFIAEALGYTVDWDSKDNSTIIDNGRITMYIGTNRAIIDGEKIELDVVTTIINERSIVPLRIIAETLDCTVDWFSGNKTVIINKKNNDGSEVSMWERFKQSDLFYECTTYESEHYGHLVLKSNYTELTDAQIAAKTKWCIKRDKDMLEQYSDAYDCELYATGYDAAVRSQLKDVLMILYPYEYHEANDIMMKTLRGEIWETFRDNVPLMMSGTWGTRYLDERAVHMAAGYGLTYFVIEIGKAGYVNPEKPLELSQETLNDLITEARKFYPLSEYGLD